MEVVGRALFLVNCETLVRAVQQVQPLSLVTEVCILELQLIAHDDRVEKTYIEGFGGLLINLHC